MYLVPDAQNTLSTTASMMSDSSPGSLWHPHTSSSAGTTRQVKKRSMREEKKDPEAHGDVTSRHICACLLGKRATQVELFSRRA